MDYGLIGEKLGHSFSKMIHEKLADYEYELKPLAKEEFPYFMEQKLFQAINVTIPYKEQVLPYLNYLDEKAHRIGAVNTIVNKNGILTGYNTDYDGFAYLLKHNHIQIEDKKVLVLGKGGASKAIIAVLEAMKASKILTVYYKKTPDTITYEQCIKYHSDAEIIINTTPVGMYPTIDASPIDVSLYKNCKAVVDVIYNPLRTKLITQAKQLGIQAVGGLEMLVAQAKYAVEIFLDKPISDTVIDSIYKQILLERSNVVLIGMPSSGKTTIGKSLSTILNKKFIDIDDKIIEKIQMRIADYFEKYGEEKFRQVETEITRELSKESGMVISTGGGCVKNKINIDFMSMNGYILFIERNLEKLLCDPERPLSKSPQVLKQMYLERYPLYSTYGEKTVLNNHELEKSVLNAKKAYESLLEQ